MRWRDRLPFEAAPFEFPRGESWPSCSDRVHNSASASLSETATVHTTPVPRPASAGATQRVMSPRAHGPPAGPRWRWGPLATGGGGHSVRPQPIPNPRRAPRRPPGPAPAGQACHRLRLAGLRVGARPLNEARPAGRGFGAASPPSHACHEHLPDLPPTVTNLKWPQALAPAPGDGPSPCHRGHSPASCAPTMEPNCNW